MTSISRENNFDLIRLFAALQVVLYHSYEHLGLHSDRLNPLIKFIEFFPGVPIFFTVSGFLIFASFTRNKSLKVYFKNRSLRIFPGLWLVFLFTFLTLLITNFININNIFSAEILAWIATNITIFQFYTPQDLRGFGVGAPNGSLWTIFIEVSFYLFIPFLFWLSKKTKLKLTYWVLVAMGISIFFNVWYDNTYKKSGVEETALIKLMGLNLLPYLFYFLGGVLIFMKWDKIKFIYFNRGLLWFIFYILYCLVFSVWLEKFVPTYWPNLWGLIGILILTNTVISLAFTNITLSKKLLKHNDISYGLYLFHMPIINIFLHLNLTGPKWSLLMIFLTILLASLSWYYVESPMLKRKNSPKFLK